MTVSISDSLTSSDGTKQSPEQEEVVARLLSGVGQRHGLEDNLMEVWLKEGGREGGREEEIRTYMYNQS